MGARRAALGAIAIATAAAISGCAGAARHGSDQTEANVAAAAANPVTVSPLPGTIDASPQTEISFLGGRGTTVSDVKVVGTRSGHHSGMLRRFATGTGQSFVPSKAFEPGEHVAVEARVGAGRGAKQARTSFTVAMPASVRETEFPDDGGDPGAVQRYSSARGLTPPAVNVITPARPGATPGEFFLAPYQGDGTPGPMIVDQAGRLVWFHPLPAGQQATNFGVQRYEGRPVLVWWQGRIIEAGFGQGEDVLYDSSYRRIASVRAGNGYAADLHEIRLTPQGTAWIDAFAPVWEDLSSVGGAKRAAVTDSVVQEIDIRTGLVMWEWHALSHVPFSESEQALAKGPYSWDYAHVNSIDPGSSGDILLSARSTSALYDVDLHTGAVRWRLGGKHSSFTFGPGVAFHWQHDARFQPGGRISLFDNGSEPPLEKQSRGVVLSLDAAGRSVSLARQLVNPARSLLSPSQGSMDGLEGGNWLLGYGRLPDFTEFDSNGQVLFDATLGRGVQDFSVSLARWSGLPSTRPSIAPVPSSGGRAEVQVSWNGATGVSSWRLLCGHTPRSLTTAATAPRTGFQTSIVTPGSCRYLKVEALGRSGTVIRASAVSRR